MLQNSVSAVLDRYGYKTRYSRDRAFITSWLELLILLKKMQIHIEDLRQIMDHLTWSPIAARIVHYAPGGAIEVERFKGTVTRNGVVKEF